MQLSKNQIQELYKFTRQHYVYHYDVQTELVDHLANDIEQIWEEHSKLSFEDARDKSFKKFGNIGFADVIKSRQKALSKKYGKILWCFVKEWFQLPKIVLTIIIFVLFFFILQLKMSFILIGIAFLILAVFDIVIKLTIGYKIKKIKKQNKPIFLLEEMIHKTQRDVFFIILVNCFNIFMALKSNINFSSFSWAIIFSAVFTVLSITFYVIEFVIPKKAAILLHETYSEYKTL